MSIQKDNFVGKHSKLGVKWISSFQKTIMKL